MSRVPLRFASRHSFSLIYSSITISAIEFKIDNFIYLICLVELLRNSRTLHLSETVSR